MLKTLQGPTLHTSIRLKRSLVLEFCQHPSATGLNTVSITNKLFDSKSAIISSAFSFENLFSLYSDIKQVQILDQTFQLKVLDLMEKHIQKPEDLKLLRTEG